MTVSALIALATAMVATASNGPASAGATAPVAVAAEPSPKARSALPGFAAGLAGRPVPDQPSMWLNGSPGAAWQGVMHSSPASRQSARWTYALTLLGNAMPAEALGVLDVMMQDDSDLKLSPAFQLARGSALVRLGRPEEGYDALAHPMLVLNAEACAWRMMALANAGSSAEALRQWNCALPAINARRGAARRPFLLAGASAAIRADRSTEAMRWLELLKPADPVANLLRGHALAKLGRRDDAAAVYTDAAAKGDVKTRLDAQLSLADMQVRAGTMKPAAALGVAETVRYRWRGGPLELRALRLAYTLADRIGDNRAALASGATLLRYYPQSADSALTMIALQERLAQALAPDSKIPLVDAAGLFWDFRDIIPSGAGGDKLASDLATRLQQARLYARAADLLNHILRTRVSDITQGPLSVRVATLYILAGEPARALEAIAQTDTTPYPDEMRWDRQRIEAVALSQLGRDDEALAVLDSVPDSRQIVGEILWRQQNWQALAQGNAYDMPDPGPLNAVEQAIVLRRAVAMAMLGDEKGLAGLRADYRASFSTLPNGKAFDILTGPVVGLDPDAVAAAMAAIPSASPAGAYGDLLALSAPRPKAG